MATGADVVATRHFLETLYGGVEDGWLAVFHLPSQQTSWVPANDLEMAAATIARLAQIGNVYFGVGIQQQRLGTGQRGTAATVHAIPGLFMDIDLREGEHALAALPTTTRDISSMLKETLPASPSMVLHSGGGLHLYWLFHEPWVLETDDERRHAARLNRSLQTKLITAAAARGWTLEYTADLARVLRPAGTINRKRPDLPIPVRIIHEDPVRYSAEELEFYLPTDQDAYRTPRASGDVPVHAPVALWGHVIGKCSFLKHCVKDAATLDEPSWHAEMTIVSRCQDGEAIAHRVSADYPGYDQAETTKKFNYALAADSPLRCSTIRFQRGGDRWCSKCPYWGTIASPIVLGYPRGYGIRRTAESGKGAAGA